MATTYHPNDTDCTGWDGYDSGNPPDTLVMDVESVLSGAELNIVSVDDDNEIVFEGGNDFSTGHRFSFAITVPPGNVTQIDVLAKGFGQHGVPGYLYKLYIWDANAVAWEFMDSHTALEKGTVSDSILANFTNYIRDVAGTDYVDILLFTDLDSKPGGAVIHTYYANIVVTSVVTPPALVMTTFLT